MPADDEMRREFEAWQAKPKTMADLSPEGVWQAAYAAGRRKGIEESAGACDNRMIDAELCSPEEREAGECADAIRALVGKEKNDASN